MMRFFLSLLTLAIGVGILLLAVPVLLPVIGLVVLIVLAAIFSPRRRRSGPAAPEPDDIPEEDVPASQAVIDVPARPVDDEQEK